MICYSCDKASSCKAFRALYSMSNDFCINDCKDYDQSHLKYKKLAEHEDLLHLIYDYFTEQIVGGYSEEQVRNAIVNALLDL